ncbi:MAG TPA: tetratricopeptide repeat protein [Spirochaetia bacterium]|nr:tetratricopeptide repeat protein [Spirochaetia bacterium]
MKHMLPAKVISWVMAGLVVAGGVVGLLFLPGCGRSQPSATTEPASKTTQGAVYQPAETPPSPNEQTALELYQKGLKLYYQRQYQPALSLFNQALALDPRSYKALNAKGATYAFLGRYDEGIALIQQAITMKPDFEYAHFNLGLANELAGRWDQAIAAYQSAIALNGQDEWSYYGIASIYGRHGNVPMVVQYLQKAINIWDGVKAIASKEHDFDPVRNDPRFQALLK